MKVQYDMADTEINERSEAGKRALHDYMRVKGMRKGFQSKGVFCREKEGNLLGHKGKMLSYIFQRIIEWPERRRRTGGKERGGGKEGGGGEEEEKE